MDKKEIERLLSQVATPIYQIEKSLGMPKTTLQKAIKGERELPKKWALKLASAYTPQKVVKIVDATKPTNEVKPPEVPQTNYTIDIKEQIRAIQLEKIPAHRDTAFGRKVWQLEQNKRIEVLKTQL